MAEVIHIGGSSKQTLGISAGSAKNITISGQNSGAIGVAASAGTTNYNALANKPSINSIPLVGDHTGPELNLRNKDVNIDYILEVDNKPQINNIELTGDKTAADLKLMSEGDVDSISNVDIEKILTGLIL